MSKKAGPGIVSSLQATASSSSSASEQSFASEQSSTSQTNAASGGISDPVSAASGATELNPVTPGAPLNQRRADLAYVRVSPSYSEYSDDELMNINFDVPSVVPQLLTTAGRVKSNRHLLEPVQPFDIRMVDEFEDYVLAFAHTHALVRIAEDTIESEDIPFLFDRRRYLLDVGAIAATAGLLDRAKLSKFDRSSDRAELAYDAMGLAQLFLQYWPKLKGNVPLTREALEALRDRANNVLLMLSTKNDKQTSVQEATLERRRAATKVFRSLRKIRIALALVLDTQEQVDEFAPRVQIRKRRKGAKGASTVVEAEGTEQDEFSDEAEDEEDTSDAAEGDDAETVNPPRTSVLNLKAKAPMKAAVGDGLPGASPIDDDE